jgi:16S rRNA (guanine527-N7)-methyltransferase
MTVQPPKWDLPLNDEKIAIILRPFCTAPSSKQISQICEYIKLLLKWNRSLNLTSIQDPAEILARHFGESMFLRSILPVGNGRLADLGTGAGFPGLALKIVSPQLQILLLESNKKKCAFLAEVVRALSLENVEIDSSRFEETRLEPNSLDFVTARALGEFSALLKWARNSIKNRGHLILWLGGEDATLISKAAGWTWSPPVRIPESQRRLLLIGQPDNK